MADDATELFAQHGIANNVDPLMMQAIAQVESQNKNYDASGKPVVSPTGAKGRMQFTGVGTPGGTGYRYGVTDPYNDQQSIPGASKLMNDNLNAAKGDVAAALRMYNGGGDPNYADKVFTAWRGLQSQQKPPPSTTGSAPVASPQPAAADDDPYVAMGKHIVQGAPEPDAAKSEDPYVAAGRAITSSRPATGPRTPIDLSTPSDPEADQKITGIPTLDNIMAGEAQGAKDVVSTGAKVASWFDDRFPALKRLDDYYGINPSSAVNLLARHQADYEASPAGQSYAGAGGRMLGGALVTAPVLGPLGAAAGAGTDAALGTIGIPNLLRTAASRAATGAVAGGGLNAATGGDVAEGAKVGAVLGPVGGAAGDVVGAGWRGAKSFVGNLTGKTEADAIDAAFAESRARSGAPPPGETGAPPPTPGAGASAPQSAGAAASRDNTPPGAIDMQAAEAEAARATGFNERIARQPKLGFDNTEYVKNSTPTTAEMHADPMLAAQQRVLTAANPEMAAIDRNNNQARLDHFDDIAGTPTQVQTLKAARDAQADKDLSAAWANKTDANAQPVVDHIKGILSGPDGKIEPVRAALNKVLDGLQKADGTGLETDPQMLYGVRKQINFQMSKLGAAETPGNADKDVMRALQSAKDQVDAAIEPAAKGFDTFRSNYHEASKPINVAEMLQEYRPKLLGGPDGATIQLGSVNTMLKSIGQRMGSDGLDSAKYLSDDQVDKLFNLRADLQRQGNRYLQKPAGSNTQHDLNLASDLGLHGATAATNHLFSKVPIAGEMAARAIDNLARNASAKNRGLLTNRLLFPEHPLVPPQGGYQ